MADETAQSTADDTAPTVSRNDDESRYEIRVGDVLGGFSEFETDADGRTAFTHTEIDPAFRGQGLGSRLIGEAMTDAAARGLTVVPYCSAVAKYLRARDVPGLNVEWPHPLSGTRP